MKTKNKRQASSGKQQSSPPARKAYSPDGERGRLGPADVAEIFRRFRDAAPEPKSELEYVNPFTLLVAVVLSAQATDAGVNKATRGAVRAADSPAKMLALGEARVQDAIKTIGLLPEQGEERHRAVAEAGRGAWRRGAGRPRRAGDAARRRPQDGECRAERRLRPADHGRGHAYIPRRQPHRPRAGKDAARGRIGADAQRAGGIPAARASLAHPARPLCLQGAQARMSALPDRRYLSLRAENQTRRT